MDQAQIQEQDQEEDVYKFIERVGSKVTERYCLVDNPALSSIHADKARQYREKWEEAGVPFLYGAFIYVMFYTYPYCTEVDRSKVAQWVIDYWNDNPLFQRIMKEEDSGKAHFTIYWFGGKREVIVAQSGESIYKAFQRAGYGVGVTLGIDRYDIGITDNFTWDSETKQWESKTLIV